MAFIDYGAIAFKNGKCIQNDYFGDMLEMVGWEDEEEHILKGWCFSYVGDKNFTVGFFKEHMIVCCDGKTETIYLNDRYIGWKKYEALYVPDNYDGFIKFVVTPRQDRCYTFKMTYNGDEYKVIFGYGIDLPYYQKTGRYNYYRSPGFLISNKLPDIIKNIPYEISIRIELLRRRHERKEQEKGREQETP